MTSLLQILAPTLIARGKYFSTGMTERLKGLGWQRASEMYFDAPGETA